MPTPSVVGSLSAKFLMPDMTTVPMYQPGRSLSLTHTYLQMDHCQASSVDNGQDAVTASPLGDPVIPNVIRQVGCRPSAVLDVSSHSHLHARSLRVSKITSPRPWRIDGEIRSASSISSYFSTISRQSWIDVSLSLYSPLACERKHLGKIVLSTHRCT